MRKRRALYRCGLCLLFVGMSSGNVYAQGEMVPPAEVIIDPNAPAPSAESLYSPPGDQPWSRQRSQIDGGLSKPQVLPLVM